MKYHYNQFFYRAFTHSYLKTFSIDGLNPGNFTFIGGGKSPSYFKKLYKGTDINAALNSANGDGTFAPSRLIASFFGIPNRIRRRSKERISESAPYNEFNGDPLTLKSVFYNFIDWPEKDEWQNNFDSKALNILFLVTKAVLYGAWNLASILPALAKNIFKIGTEFIPSVLAETCRYGVETFYNMLRKPETSLAKKVLLLPAIGLAALAYIPLKSVHIVGRAITSPITSIYAAYAFGGKVVDFFAGNKDKNRLVTQKRVLGVIFAALSVALTVAAYTIIFPLAIKAIATHVVPQLPAAIIAIAEPIVTKLKPAFEAIGVGIHAIKASFFAAMGAVSAHTGISIVIGAVLATIGTGLNLLKNLVKGKLQASTAMKSNPSSSDLLSRYQDKEKDEVKVITPNPGLTNPGLRSLHAAGPIILPIHDIVDTTAAATNKPKYTGTHKFAGVTKVGTFSAYSTANSMNTSDLTPSIPRATSSGDDPQFKMD